MPAHTLTAEPASWTDHAQRPADHLAAGCSERGQTIRFLTAIRHLELHDGDVLLDYGCGPGRLSEFVPHGIRYYGLDAEHSMIDRARANHQHPDRWFHIVADVLPILNPDPTAIACLGVWNLRRDGSTYEWIERLWATYTTARVLFASVYRGTDQRCVIHDPGELADFAGYLSCARFAIDASYLDNDVALILHR